MCKKNKENEAKFDKITLEDYYNGLSSVSPRTEFIRTIVGLTGVSETTVVNWTKGAKPQKYKHVLVLSKVTGIKTNDLWVK